MPQTANPTPSANIHAALSANQAQTLALAIAQTRAFFVTQQAFVKNHEAVDRCGKRCDPLDCRAVNFCIDGAFIQINEPENWLHRAWLQVAHQTASDVMGRKAATVFDFNDDARTKLHDVLAFFDKAIELALDSFDRAMTTEQKQSRALH